MMLKPIRAIHGSKQPIFLNSVDIYRIETSARFKHNENNKIKRFYIFYYNSSFLQTKVITFEG